MLEPLPPSNECARLRALHALGVLDTAAEERFDRLTWIARSVFAVPIALVSLVDSDRQWFKSKQGLAACETPRAISFCGHAILGNEVFVIENALDDVRFADNPLVIGPPNIRFYAGAVLYDSKGYALGTLCIIDQTPHRFDQSQRQLLAELAELVSAALQLGVSRNALQKLQEEEVRSQAVLDNMSDGVVLIDEMGLIQSINAAGERLFGYQQTDLQGQNVSRLMPSPYRERHDGYLRHYREGGPPRIIGSGREVLGLRADGTEFPLDLSVSEVRFQNRRHFVGLVRDISARKADEAAIQVLAERLDLATKAASMGIWDWDIVANTLTWDEQMFTLYGCKLEDFGGAYEAWLQGVHPDDREFCNLAIERAIAGEASYDIEFRACWPNGRVLYIKADGLVIRAADGKPLRMIGTNYDISARKQAEQQRHESQLHIRELAAWQTAILDSANVAIIATDTKGIIKNFNRCAERWLGFSASELVDNYSPAIFHDPDEVSARALSLSEEMQTPIQPGFDCFVAKARRDGVEEREWTYIARDGRRFRVQLSVTALRDQQGEVQGYLGVAIDISARKKAEEAKNAFVSMVSHELRTPLTSIRGALGLVLGKQKDVLPAKTVQLLQTALRNAERLTTLINDLLDLEKMADGKLHIELAVIDLRQLIQNAINTNAPFAQVHGVELSWHSELKTAKFSGDELRLQQVLSNLISNAVKFSPKGGQVKISLSAQNGNYRIGVRDQGPGINTEFRSRIFQRFAQADTSDAREKGGTGLGLSISKSIVEQHQGQIGFDSEPGQGTEFYFLLPIAVPPSSSLQTPTDTERRLLICDDNADVAHILVQMLAENHYDADTATSLAEARQRLENYPYAALLLDYNLPDGNGLDFLHQLRADARWARLPVVIVSGRSGQEITTADGIEILDWIQKPVELTQLMRAVQIACARHARPRVLHVEDDRDLIQVVQVGLEEVCDYTYATSLDAARLLLQQSNYDLLLLDLGLPDGNGLELLPQIGPNIPILLFSGNEPPPEVLKHLAGAMCKGKHEPGQLLQSILAILQTGKR